MTGEYRIDDLAQAAGMTVRNVRAYSERGLLMAPVRREGRAAIYDDSHLERLKIIDALLQRGFTSAHIADFITSWETGKDLTEVIGLQHAVTGSWSPKTETIDAPRNLVELFLGEDASEVVEKIADLGLIRLRGDTVTFLQPHLLETFSQLQSYGLEARHLVGIFAAINTRVTEIAQLMIRAAKTQLIDPRGPGWLPENDDDINKLAGMLNNLRELAVSTVHTTLANALDTTLQAELGDYLATAARTREHRQSS